MPQIREFTFCNADQCEVMVGLNTKTGAIVDMYCYADHLPAIDNSETGAPYNSPLVSPSKNPLFVQITQKVTVFKRMLIHGGFLVLVDDTDSDYDKDIAIIERCLLKYKIPSSIAVY